MLKNPSLKELIGFDFDSLTSNRNYQPKIFSFAQQNDFGVSQQKLDQDEATYLLKESDNRIETQFTLFELLEHAHQNKIEQVFMKVKNPASGEEKILDVGF